MGCDIHLYLERKLNNEWRSADLFDARGGHVSIYTGRNYTLFSVLADVRNDSGNAFISEAKSLPEDCNELIKKEYDAWSEDAHNASYLTLYELIAFQLKHPKMKYSGLVSKEGAEAIDAGEMPSIWCKSTNQKGFVYREWEHKDDSLKDLIEKIQDQVDRLYYFDKDTKNVRIVFWFDN